MGEKKPRQSIRELLCEIGTEEIPAGWIPSALKKMGEEAEKLFVGNRIPPVMLKTLGTPRRLVLVALLPSRQEKGVREVTGPPAKVSFDAGGNPTEAARGFARSQGVKVTDLVVRKTERGEYCCAVKEEERRETGTILRKLLPGLIASLTFPRSMRWNGGTVNFARPIRWILALYGGKRIPFEYAGVRSGNRSFGHRFMSPASFVVRGWDSYLRQAEQRFVIVDQERRREMISRGLQKIAENMKGSVVQDGELLDEATFLVEYPALVSGSFDPRYLELPREVLLAVMREQHGYFPLCDKRGRLLPHFVVVSNTKARDMNQIRRGNERVTAARFADAAFYFVEDQKTRLCERVQDLRGVIFQDRLGTMYDKTRRLSVLVSRLVERLGLEGSTPGVKERCERAALLCKADLVTGMVREFPALQGVMGREYARKDGEPEEVAVALAEHYLPRFSGDSLPGTEVGRILAIADKIDTIAGCFGIDLIPTGSEDPYALRRQGLGLVQILIAAPFRISLGLIIDEAIDLVKEAFTRGHKEVKEDLLLFFRARMEFLLKGIRHDVVEATLSSGFDDPAECLGRSRALSSFSRTEEFSSLVIAMKRVLNILPSGFSNPFRPDLLTEPEEKALYEAFLSVRKEVSSCYEKKKYYEGLVALRVLREPIDVFFLKVLVMDERAEVRTNRLALLSEIARLSRVFADFSQIEAAVTERKDLCWDRDG